MVEEVVASHIVERDVRAHADIFHQRGCRVFGGDDRVVPNDKGIGIGGDCFRVVSGRPGANGSPASAGPHAHHDTSVVVLHHRWKNIGG